MKQQLMTIYLIALLILLISSAIINFLQSIYIIDLKQKNQSIERVILKQVTETDFSSDSIN